MRGLQILLSLLLLAVFCNGDKSSEEKMEEFRAMVEDCAKEFDLTKDEIKETPRMICAGGPIDRKHSCHAACIYKKLGVMEDGKFLTEELQKSILANMEEKDKTKVESKFNECKDSKLVTDAVDECDKAIEFSKCVMEGSEECTKM